MKQRLLATGQRLFKDLQLAAQKRAELVALRADIRAGLVGRFQQVDVRATALIFAAHRRIQGGLAGRQPQLHLGDLVLGQVHRLAQRFVRRHNARKLELFALLA